MVPYTGMEAVEAANSDLIWDLLKMELTTFTDSPDVRQERGVQGDSPGLGWAPERAPFTVISNLLIYILRSH